MLFSTTVLAPKNTSLSTLLKYEELPFIRKYILFFYANLSAHDVKKGDEVTCRQYDRKNKSNRKRFSAGCKDGIIEISIQKIK